MARRRTLSENIRKYKQEYLRLLAYEARLNHQLFNMKKRIKLLAQEEELRLTEKALLSEQLQKIQQQKTELEGQRASKQRDTQLKRVEKEYKQVKARHSRNQYQLDQLEVRKDKDNVVKLLVKEAKRDDVTVRIQSTYETWMYFEQIQQWELAQQAAIFNESVAVSICADTRPQATGNGWVHFSDTIFLEPFSLPTFRWQNSHTDATSLGEYTVAPGKEITLSTR
jgi:chromosome segregation ATPase